MRSAVFAGICLSFIAAAASAAGGPKLAEKGGGADLVVYSNGSALIHEKRQVELGGGFESVVLPGVPKTLRPDSVSVQLAGGKVVEQLYDLNLLTPESLLKAHVGEEAVLGLPTGQPGAYERKRGRLLSVAGGQVWELDGKVVANPRAGFVEYDSIPEGLHPDPRLVLSVEADAPGERALDVSYLADGIGWSMDYVFELDEAGDSGELSGWASIRNQTGVDFKGASVDLMAGELNDVRRRGTGARVRLAAAMVAEADRGGQASVAGNYRRFRLGEALSLDKGQVKRVSLVAPRRVKGERFYRFRARADKPPVGGGNEYEAAAIVLGMKNDEASGLGLDLPAGVVRVYGGAGEGGDAGRWYSGGDTLSGSSKGQRLELEIGKAFGVTAKRVQKNLKSFVSHGRTSEFAWEIRVLNSREEKVRVVVEELFHSSWKLLESNVEPLEEKARSAGFELEVEGGGSKLLSYRVEITR